MTYEIVRQREYVPPDLPRSKFWIHFQMFEVDYDGLSFNAERVDLSKYGELLHALPGSTRRFNESLLLRVWDATPHCGGCGKRQEYFLEVPSDMESARQAVAWTFGMTVDEYAPEVET